MSLKTITLVLILACEDDLAMTIRYGVDLAARNSAHLQVAIGVPPLILPLATPAAEMLVVTEQDNLAGREAAEALAAMIRIEAETGGVIASTEIFSNAYDPLAPHFMHRARASDLCVTQAPPSAMPLQRDIVVDLMIGGGVPVLIVPPAWDKRGAIRTALIAWDGSAAAARALRDALPLLGEAKSVEIVSILGEKDLSGQVPCADIARHLARHGLNVSASQLPMQDGSVARTLIAHGKLMRADMVVMGGYGHSRLREFILGGVTRETLAQTDIPTLLSH